MRARCSGTKVLKKIYVSGVYPKMTINECQLNLGMINILMLPKNSEQQRQTSEIKFKPLLDKTILLGPITY